MTTPDQVKACCAGSYGSDVVAMLLGDAFHPGGLALTHRLAGHLGLAEGQRVLDVACGLGTSALMLADRYGVHVDGIDLSPANVALAQGAAAAAGLSTKAGFTVGDAEALPYPDSRFDAVISECAFCTFPGKADAAREVARVLRPGGKLGITDVIAQPDRLPTELTGLAAWVACIADARPMDQYAAILSEAGLAVARTERHDAAILRMIDQIEARLSVVRMTARDRVQALGIDFCRVPAVLAAARSAVVDDALGYGLLVAEKPVVADASSPNSPGPGPTVTGEGSIIQED